MNTYTGGKKAGFPYSSVGKESTCNGLIPGQGDLLKKG